MRATAASCGLGSDGVFLEWQWAKATTYPVKLIVHCDDRAGMLKELTGSSPTTTRIYARVDSKPTPEGMAVVEFVIETQDVRHLNKLLLDMRRVAGVREVQRVQRYKYSPPLRGAPFIVPFAMSGIFRAEARTALLMPPQPRVGEKKSRSLRYAAR